MSLPLPDRVLVFGGMVFHGLRPSGLLVSRCHEFLLKRIIACPVAPVQDTILLNVDVAWWRGRVRIGSLSVCHMPLGRWVIFLLRDIGNRPRSLASAGVDGAMRRICNLGDARQGSSASGGGHAQEELMRRGRNADSSCHSQGSSSSQNAGGWGGDR